MIFLTMITGMFHDFILFATLLFIHELGHSLTGITLGWKLVRIRFFPYGGVTEFETSLNQPLWQELLVLIMGPIFQVICFFFLTFLIQSPTRIDSLKSYHYSLLIFNLLPINPLDGGKLVSILFYYFFPFYRGMKISITLSFFILFLVSLFLFTHYFQWNLFFIFSIVLIKLIEENKKVPFYYHRFLLERYLLKTKYKKRKVIKRIEDMYRDKKHIIFSGLHYDTEQAYLRKYFKNGNKNEKK